MDNKELLGRITLPSSKSISNRLLILNALAVRPCRLGNLSDSEDTRVMQQALKARRGVVDIGHAGTAMRFLTAYLSTREGSYVLTGSERMKQRPIAPLVTALRELGARIEYLETPGYPPLSIEGGRLKGGGIGIDPSISSQYVSALMMIGPSLKGGLTIDLQGEVVSSSYIRLTLNLMSELGIPVRYQGKRIRVPHLPFEGKDMEVEGDWSAAGYWYSMAALSEKAELEIRGLRRKSSQGDSVLPEIFRPLGVKTTFLDKGIKLERGPRTLQRFSFDFSDNPDLVQTMAVVCGLLGLPFEMKGTRTLKIKETDRIHALQAEMGKLGIQIETDPGGDWLSWNGKMQGEPVKLIRTYLDHRMAMAFCPAVLRFPGLTIEDPEVVRKSYPGFWDDMAGIGMRIEKLA